MPTEQEIAGALPLKPAALHVLLAVADRPQHGYAIMVEVMERTAGQVRLWPATLYTKLRQLLDAGLLREVASDKADDDPRRRYYELTRLGNAVLDAEADRLQALVDTVRAKRSQPSSV